MTYEELAQELTEEFVNAAIFNADPTVPEEEKYRTMTQAEIDAEREIIEDFPVYSAEEEAYWIRVYEQSAGLEESHE